MFVKINQRLLSIFESGPDKFYEDSKIFRNPVELYRNFRISYTGRLLSHHIGFFINAKMMLSGFLQCGMGHSFQKNRKINVSGCNRMAA